MPTIAIHRPHRLPLARARVVVDEVATRMREKFGLAGDWQGDTLHFSRPGVNGSIAISAEAIDVRAELGLLLAPLKGVVEAEIRHKLDEHFA
ncbi:MAG TPA: polyhydroxyalkanoic acid system family protein [Rhodanobacter sp.]|nr:polyhydroxyalkanoic acid system family protein [Rhodanobacter sp.]